MVRQSRAFGLSWLIIVLAAPSHAAALKARGAPAVMLELNESSLEDSLRREHAVAIAFYAPWCPHSERLWPELAKVKDIFIGRVDVTQHKEVAQKHEISSYPTLKLFEHGELIAEYEGPNEHMLITKWLGRKTRKVVRLDNWTMTRDFIAQAKDALVVGVNIDLTTAARAIDDERVQFAHAIDIQFVQDLFEHDIEPPGIAVVSAFGERSWVTAADDISARLVPALTIYEAGTFWNVGPSVQALWFSVDDFEPIAHIAERYRDRVRHVIVPEKEVRVRERFQTESGLVLVDQARHRYYKKHPDIDIEVFYDDFFNDRLRPSLRSEPAYASDQDTPIIRLVGSSFHNFVNKSHDTLVAFVAPWCMHCQALQSIWDQLADLLRPVDSLRLATMDATKNEIDAIDDITAFPTIYFFAMNKAPERYVNDRSLEAILAYLKQRATHAFQIAAFKSGEGMTGSCQQNGAADTCKESNS